MQLKWIGDPRNVVGVEGWPAADHDEPDNKVATAKVKSGLYTGPTNADLKRERTEATQRKRDANTKAAQQSDQRISEAEESVAAAQGTLADTRRSEGRET